MTNKIIVLCDYGLDDAAATTYLLRNADKFEQIDILPIGGNVPLAMSMNNAKRLLAQVEELPNNVRLVDTDSIKQPEEYIDYIHGKDGIGDFLPEESDYNGPILNYDEWIKTIDTTYTIVSLGPCTVTLDILNKVGACPILFMAGNISEPPNYNGYEFNHGMDADAFAQCVKYEHKIATLDTCHYKLCDFNKVKLDGDGLFEKVVKRSVELSNERKENGCYIYDLITVVYLIHPEKYETEVRVDEFGNTLSVLKYVDDEMIM